MSDKADRFCHAIDNLLFSQSHKTLVAEPEVQGLLRIAQLRRDIGRRMVAIGASHQKESWQRLEATLQGR